MTPRTPFVRILWIALAAGAVIVLRPPHRPVEGLGTSPKRAPRQAASQRPSAEDVQEQLSRGWNEVKPLLKAGAYDQALERLDAMDALAPGDSRIRLYRTLCQERLRSEQPYVQLSPTQLRELQHSLAREGSGQKRSAAIQRAVKRQVRREQEQWDKNLEAQVDQAQQAEQAQRRQAQADAVARARAEREMARTVARESAVQQAQVPQPREEDVPVIEPAGRSVELAPVTVPVAEAPAVEETSPSLRSRAVPLPGAVQINARQMSVSPDRRVAVAEGDVEVIFENALLTCDRMTLFTDTKDVYAEGQVRIEQGAQVFRGDIAHYNFETKKGRFLEGTVSSPPWHQHGRTVEHIAEGVYEVTPGYLTTCELEPPHFQFRGRRATVFAEDRIARAQNVALFVEQVPFLYLPYLSLADRQSPFFIRPGKKKPWEQFALMGYRYELPGTDGHQGVARLDWRRAFGWGTGVDHMFESPKTGKGLVRLYYNELPNRRALPGSLPKGAKGDRYRVLVRHHWEPAPSTTVLTNFQKFSDEDYRQDFLFREEFVDDDVPESFVSLVRNDPNVSVTGVVRKRVNRFQTGDEALPQVTFDLRQQRLGETWFFTEGSYDIANFEHKTRHSGEDADVVRADWFQELSYAVSWLRPLEITPRAGMRQTYYTKDIQGERPHTNRDLLSGQVSAGADTSVKFFKILPVTKRLAWMNVEALRHVVTPTISYDYVHRPTVANSLVNFPAARGPSNQVTFGLENKLQGRRRDPEHDNRLASVDLARFLIGLPYAFHSNGNKQGGRLGDWAFDAELYPWSWMRIEADWKINSIKPSTADANAAAMNVDLVVVGGKDQPNAQHAPHIVAPQPVAYEPGPRSDITLLPQGQWFLGLGHRYSRNDKTEEVVQFDWRLSEKWQLSTFHRFTIKEVAGTSKRFNNVREYQYSLRRDLHDWLGEVVYRVDREFGEELFLTLTLKAYPDFPLETQTSYHQPKQGSQSSPFSPVKK